MHIKQWVKFSIIRLAFVIVPLVVLLVLRVSPLIAVLAATIIGLALSIIFLHKQRSELSSDLYAAKQRRNIPIEKDGPSVVDPDADFENEVIDTEAHKEDASGSKSQPAGS